MIIEQLDHLWNSKYTKMIKLALRGIFKITYTQDLVSC